MLYEYIHRSAGGISCLAYDLNLFVCFQIYGKALRREAITRLREHVGGDRGRTSLVEPQHCCALQDVIVNQAAKIHEQLAGGSLQALRLKTAPDNQNAALVRLDVDNVRVEATDGGHTLSTYSYLYPT